MAANIDQRGLVKVQQRTDDPALSCAYCRKPVDPAASLWMTQAGAFSGAGPFGGVSLSSVQIRIDFGDTPVAPAAPVKDKDDPDPRAG